MERDTEHRQPPLVGDLACLDPQLPLLVVDIQPAGLMSLMNPQQQAFYCDNDHGIIWFDQLPAHTPMAQILERGALLWLPLIWLNRYPDDIK